MNPKGVRGAVDWLTVTLPARSTDVQYYAFQMAISNAVREGVSNEPRKHWAWQGYHGKQQGGLRWGERDDGWIAVGVGGIADTLIGGIVPDGVHCARIDLAVTVTFDEDFPGVAETLARTAAIARETGLMHPATRIRLESGFGNGDTLYIGSRNSDQYLCLYDKARQSGKEEYKNAWRWELRLQNDKATQCLGAICTAENRGQFVRDYVAGYILSRGLVDFQHMGYYGSNTTTIVGADYDKGKAIAVARKASCANRAKVAGKRIFWRSV